MHAVALAVGIVLTSISQILLRRGAGGKVSWYISFLNVYTALAYGLFLIVTILNVYAMKTIQLKTITTWISLTYVLTLFLSGWILKEKLNGKMILGVLLIAIGIAVYSMQVS